METDRNQAPQDEQNGGSGSSKKNTGKNGFGGVMKKIFTPFARAMKYVFTVVKNLFIAPAGVSSEGVEQSHRRVRIASVIVTVLLCILVLYYAFLMLAMGGKYSVEAFEAQNRTFETAARRGNIYDANGNALAVTVDTFTVSVSREEIKNYGETKYKDGDVDDYRRLVAKGIGDRTGVDAEWIFEELKKETGNYKNVAVNIESSMGEAVKQWISEEKIKGVTVTATTSRYYPFDTLAAHLIGFTGTDNYGLVCGIEVELNNILAGRNGKVLATVEKNGNAIPGENRTIIQKLQNGYNVNLTVDKNIQQIAEDVLNEAARDFGVSEGGAILVLDPKDASVLALASYPSFNLNDPFTVPDGLREQSYYEEDEDSEGFLQDFIWKNRAISISYEPGSTFKAITAAIALEEGVVTPESVELDTPLELQGWTIHCSTGPAKTGHGEETFRLAVANSCNPVMARVALRVGVKQFYKYVRSFGFYNRTNILLSGEQVGVLHTNPQEIDLAVMAFGQRFTITPIQLASAYCAIANGGILYEPRIVSSITDSDGREVAEYKNQFAPKEVRRVISGETSKTVLELLEGVVTQGTGGRAYISGYRVAGKTGTSETTTTQTNGRYVVSFASIAPADRPEIVVLVMFDHPSSEYGDISGSRMGAWAAGKVIKRVLEYKQVKKIYTEEDAAKIRNVYYANDLTGQTLLEAMNWIKTSSRAYNVIIVGDPETHPTVSRQYPEAGVYTARECTQILYFTDDPDAAAAFVKVPDVVGMDICEAHNTITSLELNMDCRNGDIIVAQDIEPGTLVEKGTVIVMKAVPKEQPAEETGDTENTENTGARQ